jgi:high-affinity iron transporter
LAKDYSGAVENGLVKSEGEYAEQLEFSKTASAEVRALDELAKDTALVAGLDRLATLIATKADAKDVSVLARQLQTQVIQLTHLEMSPSRWPSLGLGRDLYAANCSSCHGEKGHGDGPAGVGLDPKPANFMSDQVSELSPFQAFNTIRVGVPGTGMPPFPQMSDEEIWSLAFFIVSLRHTPQAASIASSDLAFDSEALKDAASSSDVSLTGKIEGTEERKSAIIAALRLHSNGDGGGPGAFIEIAHKKLQDVVQSYRENRFDDARTAALKAYLEGIEPIEPRLKANDPSAVVRLEEQMTTVRNVISARKPLPELLAAVNSANAEIRQAQELLQTQAVSPYLMFVSAAAIVAREGFEAVLLIIVLLGVIRAAGVKRAAWWVHAGWLAALGCGGLAWFLSGWLIQLSGASRELMEAITALVAVGVLLYVGFWLHRQTEIGRWRAFLDNKVQSLLVGGNLVGLGFISFIAAFREVFETVLFLRAISSEGGDAGKTAIALGVLSALGSILVLSWILLRFSSRLPIRKLFTASAAVMGLVAVMLTGKGMHSLQEVGHISVTSTYVPIRWDLLGLYPTLETLASQFLVIAVVCFIWFSGRKPTAALEVAN